MNRRSLGSTLLAALAAVLIGAALVPPVRAAAAEVDIPYQKFVLENGLTLIVHEDHKTPTIAVNVWYHVGSKNEKPGRTGFAHLFEHLMFNGSEHFDDDYFQASERLGATDLNGTTNEDRTNYFQNVPTSALDAILWLESDRMGHLLGAVTQAKLDEQRGVVQNEKRQGENQPYALSEELITKSTFPAGHPYSWTVIGSMEDLNAAKLEDVHEWFKSYYGPANAVLVVAGDIDAATAKRKVEQYFGDIPSGPPISRPSTSIAKRSGVSRGAAQDRVPHSRLYEVWNVPEWSSADRDYLELAADVLASGKTSRLYERLVYREQIARDVRVFVDAREIASQFLVLATAQPGVELDKLEREVDEELAKFLAEGPTEEELRRVKSTDVAGFVRGVERIGGFGGKSDILAQSQVYGGSPDFYKTSLRRRQEASAEDVKRAARSWLSDGVYKLEITPFPKYDAAASGADRSKMPAQQAPPVPHFAKFERAELPNGLKLVVAERHAVPVIELGLMFDAGYAADPAGASGTAKLALDMIDEGTKTRNALQISEQLALLGAQLGTGSDLDVSTVSLSALKANLDGSLELFADVVLNPAFPPQDFDRLRKQQLTTIQAEKQQPFGMALRVLPGLLYGREHAYGRGFSGSGTEASVSKLTREDLVKFYEAWVRPNNATLVVVGDTTLAEIKPKLTALFQGWKAGAAPKKSIASVTPPPSPKVYIIDRPGSQQSVILAGNVAPPRGKDDVSVKSMNEILGGSFTSRMNMNLREDKHWSYGAFSVVIDARGQRPFLAIGPVQTDKTKESMQEMRKELQGIVGPRPIEDAEMVKVRDKQVLELPGTWETNDAVAGAIAEIVRFGLDDHYYDRFPDEVRALSVASLSGAAKQIVLPDKLIWVIVGDRAKIEAGIRELNFGPLGFLDADGNPIR